jgi:hypothetical protein
VSEPVYDFIVLGCAPHITLTDPEHVEMLDRLAQRSAMGQYKKQRPKALVMDKIEWLITDDWEEVERFQPAHDCATCRAGNDQAVAYLKEHPDRWLALGNMKYWEVW